MKCDYECGTHTRWACLNMFFHLICLNLCFYCSLVFCFQSFMMSSLIVLFSLLIFSCFSNPFLLLDLFQHLIFLSFCNHSHQPACHNVMLFSPQSAIILVVLRRRLVTYFCRVPAAVAIGFGQQPRRFRPTLSAGTFCCIAVTPGPRTQRSRRFSTTFWQCSQPTPSRNSSRRVSFRYQECVCVLSRGAPNCKRKQTVVSCFFCGVFVCFYFGEVGREIVAI